MDREPFTTDRNQNVAKMNPPPQSFVNLLSAFLIFLTLKIINVNFLLASPILFQVICERAVLSNDTGARVAISYDTSYTLSKF